MHGQILHMYIAESNKMPTVVNILMNSVQLPVYSSLLEDDLPAVSSVHPAPLALLKGSLRQK